MCAFGTTSRLTFRYQRSLVLSLFYSFPIALPQDKKKNGSLELQRRRAKLQAGNAPAASRSSSDILLCFGDVVCLDHHMTNLRLACDIWVETMPGKGVFSVSAVRGGARSPATSRSAFKIVPPIGVMLSDDDPSPVPYGSPFRLEAMLAADEESVAAGLLAPVPTCFLSSTHKSERMSSRLTNRQVVYMATGSTPDSLWTFERAVFSQGPESAEDKYFSKGQPVEVRFPCIEQLLPVHPYSLSDDRFSIDPLQWGVQVVIQHMATRVPLLADPKQTEYTDFGSECEVVCQVL